LIRIEANESNSMNNRLAHTILFIAFFAASSFAEDIRFQLANGGSAVVDVASSVEVTVLEQGVERTYAGRIEGLKTTAGKPDGQYFMLEGDFGRKLIMIRDVAAIASTGSRGSAQAKDPMFSDRSPTSGQAADAEADASGKQVVLYLPLEGGVGQEFRHQEIVKIGEYADELSPGGGAIIVLKINSNGGLVAESIKINDTIREIKSRGHRVVSWIRKAISAGCNTAMACDEIVFNPLGTAGSVTTVRGTASVDESQDPAVMEHLIMTAKESGYSEHVARSMKLNRYMTAYVKDPETGKVEWYGGVDGNWYEPLPEGAVVISTKDQNLSFNASNALACGFSRGTCRDLDEVAEYLNLPDGEWYVTDTRGEKLAKTWADTYKECTSRMQILSQRWQFKGSAEGAEAQLQERIKILREFLYWARKAPLVVAMNGPFGMDEEEIVKNIQRQIKLLEQQLRDLRRG
jgi:ATP-dependent protease ClpP protease subunit